MILLIYLSCEDKKEDEDTTLIPDTNPTEVTLWGEVYSVENTDTIYLNISGLIGPIPSEIGNLTNLVWLGLSYNQLTGEIPESICDLNVEFSNSGHFLISTNQLCPPYPPCIEDYVGYQDTSDCD